ncbi:MAG: hypothetical protein FJ149_12640 [Euryarchaeota archaeon]|nr:hypothetical protein [Euryarchaeota archaeon]
MDTGPMAYVVIVCSSCRLARGASETARTASCPNCGRRMRLAGRKKYCRSESLDHIREAVGRLNARLKGGLDIYLDDLCSSLPDAKPGAACPPRGSDGGGEEQARRERERLRQSGRAVPTNKLDRAIVICLMGRGALTAEELRPLLPVKCQPDQLEKRLEALRRAGLLYEPRAGRFALVQ